MKDKINQGKDGKDGRYKYTDIEFKGKIYDTITTLCQAYDIPTNTIYGRIRNGLSVQEAIQKSLDNQIHYNGKIYNHLAELAEDNNMNYIMLQKYVGRADSIESGIQNYLQNYKQRTITVWGKNYETFLEIEKTYGLKEGTLGRMCHSHKDTSIEDVILEMLDQGVEFNGKVYDSLASLASEYDMLYQNLHNRLRLGWNLKATVTTPINVRNRNKITIYYRDVGYTTKNELLREYGIDYQYIKTISKRTSEWIDAFDLVVRFLEENNLYNHPNKPSIINYTHMIIYNDKWYEHLRDFAKDCNVNLKTLTYIADQYDKDHITAMEMLKNKTKTKYKLDNKLYTCVEIMKVLKIGYLKINEYVKNGIIEPVEIPQYPDCTFNKTGLCFNYKLEFEKFLNEHIEKTNPK